ncbi:MAG TPA: hypothetical protein VIL41_03880, partial [Coriobacteriia bacterium]
MPHLFADRTLAERIERSVARDLEIYADTCARLDPALGVAQAAFAGGLALFLAPGSPVDMVYGAGFTGAVTTAEVDRVERFYAEHGARAAISLCPLADESLVAQLGVRGWMIADFENVLVRELVGAAEALELPRPAPGVGLRVASGPWDRARWAAVSSGAFSAPEPASAEVVRLGDALAARDDVTLLAGTVDGVDAGTGALWVDDGMGWLL